MSGSKLLVIRLLERNLAGGPAALLNATFSDDGTYLLIQGMRVTGFSNEEEVQNI
jgi:hypothetical protein